MLLTSDDAVRTPRFYTEVSVVSHLLSVGPEAKHRLERGFTAPEGCYTRASGMHYASRL